MMTGEVIGEKNMIKKTVAEIKLKSLLTAERILQEEIQKRTKKMVLSKEICPLRSRNNFHSTLEALRTFLDENKFLWAEIKFCYKNPCSIFLFDSNAMPEIFFLGRRDFIEENIQEIAGRIIARNEWIGRKAGISLKELDITNFI